MAQLYAGNQNLNCRQTWRLDENNLSLKTYLNSGLNPALVSSQCLLHSHYVLLTFQLFVKEGTKEGIISYLMVINTVIILKIYNCFFF